MFVCILLLLWDIIFSILWEFSVIVSLLFSFRKSCTVLWSRMIIFFVYVINRFRDLFIDQLLWWLIDLTKRWYLLYLGEVEYLLGLGWCYKIGIEVLWLSFVMCEKDGKVTRKEFLCYLLVIVLVIGYYVLYLIEPLS